ncbi:hypothetical protein TSUD_160050 [Trifolium subterraneum]|uniref:Uncharacterized protein n=1 Tax=Trifolium subterraneum TaxID=3900 RepID=A0A2Z6MW10_TRISU|nr:hypothetical protein TSUD_160050 [Trifolium subterraneum]
MGANLPCFVVGSFTRANWELAKRNSQSVFDDPEEYIYFVALVQELHGHARELPPSKLGLLHRLRRMKRRFKINLPFIHAVEDAD